MQRVKTAAVIALFVICFGIAGRLDKETAQEIPKPQEDELFWDCTTSGNYQCGEPITNWPIPDAIRR